MVSIIVVHEKEVRNILSTAEYRFIKYNAVTQLNFCFQIRSTSISVVMTSFPRVRSKFCYVQRGLTYIIQGHDEPSLSFASKSSTAEKQKVGQTSMKYLAANRWSARSASTSGGGRASI